jgi:SAM-dependent methyltransferase
VVELGCGNDGGLVPCLRRSGYRAVGVDPEAPPGHAYCQSSFEEFRPVKPIDAFVTSAALHHVGDLGYLLDQVAAMLAPGGVVVVVEWAWELFDELTASWCFARLAPDRSRPNWLRGLEEGWTASGLGWRGYEEQWALQARCHRGEEMLDHLNRRFERRVLERSPYFHYDLEATTEAAERAAVEVGLVKATGIRYAGTKPG